MATLLFHPGLLGGPRQALHRAAGIATAQGAVLTVRGDLFRVRPLRSRAEGCSIAFLRKQTEDGPCAA